MRLGMINALFNGSVNNIRLSYLDMARFKDT